MPERATPAPERLTGTVLVTGGAGFIGSALVRHILRETSLRVVNVDKLTYAGHLDSLSECIGRSRYAFEHVDVCDGSALRRVLAQYTPDAVLHLAAESHVDRSIDEPADFIRTNIGGTFTLLQEVRRYWDALAPHARRRFRVVHVSTDEVFGALAADGVFTERSAYQPNSPYAASKAAADHLVRAWHHTYGLPLLTTNCCNNYGPYQFPEKLIPLTIERALAGQAVPVYGTGEHIRDWLYVNDHVRALLMVLELGTPGQMYCISAQSERRNIDVTRSICELLDELAPDPRLGTRSTLIEFVPDRPGHDFRYALDPRRIRDELGWFPRETFESGTRKTVMWYLAHRDWTRRVQIGARRGPRLELGGIA